MVLTPLWDGMREMCGWIEVDVGPRWRRTSSHLVEGHRPERFIIKKEAAKLVTPNRREDRTEHINTTHITMRSTPPLKRCDEHRHCHHAALREDHESTSARHTSLHVQLRLMLPKTLKALLL